MSPLDWILAGIIVVSVIAAAKRGFVYEAWMIAATIVAVIVAGWEEGAAARWLGWIPSAEARHVIGFVLVLAAVLIASTVLGRIVRGLVRAVGLGWIDRLLGAGLGLVRGVVLCAAVVLAMTAFPLRARWVRISSLAPDMLWGSRMLADMVPAGMRARFEAGARTEWRKLVPEADAR